MLTHLVLDRMNFPYGQLQVWIVVVGFTAVVTALVLSGYLFESISLQLAVHRTFIFRIGQVLDLRSS